MSIDSMSTRPTPPAPCPYAACGPTGTPDTSVRIRTTVDFDCPRLAAPGAVVDLNLTLCQKVPDPDDADPELVHYERLPGDYPGQALLYGDQEAGLYEDEEAVGTTVPVAIFGDVIGRLGCLPGQRGCRD